MFKGNEKTLESGITVKGVTGCGKGKAVNSRKKKSAKKEYSHRVEYLVL